MYSVDMQLQNAVMQRDEAQLQQILSLKEKDDAIHDLIMEIGIEGLSPFDEKMTDYYFIMSHLREFYPKLRQLIWPV